MFAFIVIAMFVILGAALLVWCLSPSYRRRLEEPKYRFQAMQRAIDGQEAADTPRKHGVTKKADTDTEAGP